MTLVDPLSQAEPPDKNNQDHTQPSAKPQYFILDEPRLRKLRELGLVPDTLYTYLASKIEQPFNKDPQGKEKHTRLKVKRFRQKWGINCDRTWRRVRRKLEDLDLWDGLDHKIDLLIRNPEDLPEKVIPIHAAVEKPDKVVRDRTKLSTTNSLNPLAYKQLMSFHRMTKLIKLLKPLKRERVLRMWKMQPSHRNQKEVALHL